MEKCETCGKEFATDAALAQHMKDKHGTEAPQPVAEQEGQQKPASKSKPKSLRRRNRHPRLIALVAVVIVGLVGVYFVAAPAFAPAPFACATGESWIHIHPYLQIRIEGNNVSIPTEVGVIPTTGCVEPVHTHDNSGLLHIELSQADARDHNYTLGDFFAIWNYTAAKQSSTAPTLNGARLPVVFSSTDLLGYKTNSTYQVVLLVDGQPSTDWASLNLEKLNYCSTSMAGLPCCPTDCNSGVSSGPYWDGSPSDYPYGTSHTIVLEYVKV